MISTPLTLTSSQCRLLTIILTSRQLSVRWNYSVGRKASRSSWPMWHPMPPAWTHYKHWISVLHSWQLVSSREQMHWTTLEATEAVPPVLRAGVSQPASECTALTANSSMLLRLRGACSWRLLMKGFSNLKECTRNCLCWSTEQPIKSDVSF